MALACCWLELGASLNGTPLHRCPGPQNPHWPTLERQFQEIAHAIYETNPYYLIEAIPHGLVAAMSLRKHTGVGSIRSHPIDVG